MMRDSARFHFGFTVPFVPHVGAAARGRSGVGIQGRPRPGAGLRHQPHGGAWWTALEFESAPKIIARLPFVDRPDHPAPLHVFVVSRAAADAMVTEVEIWSVRVAGWSARPPRAASALAEIVAVPDSAFDGAALLVSVPAGGELTHDQAALVKAGATVRSAALVGSHATRYKVPADQPKPLNGSIAMTATRPQPRKGVLEIDAYVPGKSSAPGVAKMFKLSSNETPLGPSPKAIAAYNAAGEHLEDYPDGSASALREAIGRVFGLDPDRIVCGAGSDDLLNLLARAYLADGDEAIHTTHGFLVYPIATLGTGATPVVAPEKDFTADVDAILKRGDADEPRSCSSPTRTIRPAPMCRSTRSSGCTRACRRMCCW